MTIQTMTGHQARLNISRHGSGREHYHLIVSRTTGLNGATTTRAYDELQPAQVKALMVRDVHQHAGFIMTEIQNGSILKMQHGDTVRYLFVRTCNLRHAR